jgi:hypothetical protein
MKKLFLFIYILIMPFMPYVKAEIAESYNINQTNNNFVIVGAPRVCTDGSGEPYSIQKSDSYSPCTLGNTSYSYLWQVTGGTFSTGGTRYEGAGSPFSSASIIWEENAPIRSVSIAVAISCDGGAYGLTNTDALTVTKKSASECSSGGGGGGDPETCTVAIDGKREFNLYLKKQEAEAYWMNSGVLASSLDPIPSTICADETIQTFGVAFIEGTRAGVTCYQFDNFPTQYMYYRRNGEQTLHSLGTKPIRPRLVLQESDEYVFDIDFNTIGSGDIELIFSRAELSTNSEGAIIANEWSFSTASNFYTILDIEVILPPVFENITFLPPSCPNLEDVDENAKNNATVSFTNTDDNLQWVQINLFKFEEGPGGDIIELENVYQEDTNGDVFTGPVSITAVRPDGYVLLVEKNNENKFIFSKGNYLNENDEEIGRDFGEGYYDIQVTPMQENESGEIVIQDDACTQRYYFKIPDAPVVAISQDIAAANTSLNCFGDNTTLTAMAERQSGDELEYELLKKSGSIFSAVSGYLKSEDSGTEIQFSNVEAGVYKIRVRYKKNESTFCNWIESSEITISQPDQLGLTAETPPTIPSCIGGSDGTIYFTPSGVDESMTLKVYEQEYTGQTSIETAWTEAGTKSLDSDDNNSEQTFDLPAGKYTVALIRNPSCIRLDGAEIVDTRSYDITITPKAPTCKDGQDGKLILTNYSGSQANTSYSISKLYINDVEISQEQINSNYFESNYTDSDYNASDNATAILGLKEEDNVRFTLKEGSCSETDEFEEDIPRVQNYLSLTITSRTQAQCYQNKVSFTIEANNNASDLNAAASSAILRYSDTEAEVPTTSTYTGLSIGANTVSASGLDNARDYYVEVFDGTCDATSTIINFTEKKQPLIAGDSDNPTYPLICFGDDTNINLSMSNTQGDLNNYNLNLQRKLPSESEFSNYSAFTYDVNSSVSLTLKNLPYGVYKLNGEDGEGCQFDQFSFTINQPSQAFQMTKNELEVKFENNSTDYHVSVYGGSDGMLEVTYLGGEEPYVLKLFDDNNNKIAEQQASANTSNIFNNLRASDSNGDPIEYRLEATDNLGCALDPVYYSLKEPDPLELIYDLSTYDNGNYNIQCFDGVDEIHVTVDGGIPEYRVILFTESGDTFDEKTLSVDGGTVTFNNVDAGFYTIEVLDKNNFSGKTQDEDETGTFELKEPLEIGVTTSKSPPTCFQGFDGEFSVEPNGGVPNNNGEYLITFYDSDKNPIPGESGWATELTLVATSGDYFYTIIDDLDGCPENFVPFSIDDIARLEISSLTHDYAPCAGDNAAILKVQAINGRSSDGTYTVELYDDTNNLLVSEITSTSGYYAFEDLFIGDYRVKVVDDEGCSVDQLETVKDRLDSLVITEISTSPSTCANSNDAKMTVFGFGGDDNHYYSIDNGDNWYNAQVLNTDTDGYLTSEYTFEGLSSGGTYEVWLKDGSFDADAFNNSCLITGTKTIETTPQLLLNVEKEDVSCYDATDGSLSIYPSYGDEKGLSFFDIKVLKNGDLFAENILELTDLAPANYKVEVRLSAEGACGVVARKEVSISRPPLPLYADIQSTTNYNCANPSEIIVRGNIEGGWPKNGYEYKFNNSTYESFIPDGAEFRFTESLTIGEHVLTIRDSKGCEESTIFTVEPLNFSVEVLKQTDVSCYGGNDGLLQLTSANGNLAYKLWNATDSFKIAATDTALFDAVPAGNFQLVASSGACISDTLNFTFNSPDEITIDYTTLNQPGCGEANGEVVTNISGGVAPYTTNWLYKGGQLLAADALMAGDYIVIVEDAMGCQKRDSVYLEEQTDLSATVADISQATCGAANASVTLNITGGVPGYSIEWYNSQNALVGNGSLLGNISKGTYYYQLSDQSGCAITDTVFVGGDEALSVSIANSTAASCGIANGSVSLSVSGGNAPYTVNWPTTIPVTNGLSSSGLKGGMVYEVLVTDSTNCEQTFKFSINNTSGPELSINQFNPSCGSANGTIELTSITGKEPLSITWNGVADTSRLKTGLGEGTYSITVTDADSCSTTKVVELEEDLSNQLTVSNSITPSSCGGSNGVIELNIRGGFAPYQISWDDNASITEGRRTNLAAGTYEVTITDSVGCQIEKSIVLNEVASPLLTVESFVQASCGTANGSIVLSQLSNDYRYHWSHDAGITTNSAENLSAGKYDIYAENGLCTTDTLSFYITSPGTDLNISVVETVAATCETTYDGAAEINISGGASPYTISWNDEQNQNIERASNLLPGTYTVLVTDASGCSAVKSVTVGTVNPIYIASFNKETPSCHTATDGSIEVVVAGGTGNYSYLWSTGASSKTLTGIAAGTYSVEVFDNDECAVSESVTIIAPDSLSLQASVAAPRCYESANGSAELSINGGTAPYSISWPDGNTSLRRYDLLTGDYTVEVTDENGCSLTQVVTVPQKDSATISYNIQHASCFNANDAGIELTSIGNARSPLVKWSNGQRGPVLRNVTAGNYTATITDANGCATAFEFTITEPDLLELVEVEVAATKCNDASNGSITYEVKGGTAPYTYRWSDGAISKNRSGLRAGIYEVLVTDNAGCAIAESFEIEEPEPLVITAELTGVSCFGSADGQATVEVNGGTAPYQISWPDGGTTFTREDLTAGRYDVTITDTNNCSLTQRLTIDNINPIEIESISRDIPSCYQGSDGSISIEVAGGSGDYTISWENGAQGATITNIAAGTYAVTITDGNGCTFNGSIRLDDAAPINISQLIVADPICYDEPSGMVAVTPSGGSAPYKVIWEDGIEALERNDLLAGTHNFTIQDAEGCTTAYEVTMENPPLEELSNLPEIVYLCTGGYITLDAGNWDTYSWTSDNTFSSTEREVRIDAEGNYHIEVTNEAGCIDAHDIEVIKDDDLLQADFLLTSEAVVGDTVLIIDISWPMPSTVEWFNPDDKDFYLVSQEADYQEVIFTRTGEFEMSMKANLDQCEAYVTKTINVLSQDEAARLKEEELSKSQGKLHLSTNIYPNPNYGTFRLEVEGNQQHDIDVRIVDLHKGYKYYQLSGKQQQKHVFNITDNRLPAGVYIAVIETNGQTISKRFVVK